jgi:DNA repair protein RadA/Sms
LRVENCEFFFNSPTKSSFALAKVKKLFVCSNCSAQSLRWIGKCPTCNEWNTYQEEVSTPNQQKTRSWSSLKDKDLPDLRPIHIEQITTGGTDRMVTPDDELNRVLGGGLVPGAMILVAGQPGIGKSTLLLQIALELPARVLYISGEESEEQIKMRAERIGNPAGECIIYTETNVEQIVEQAKKIKPDLLVIDSIQTMHSAYIESTPGTITQIRESTSALQQLAKRYKIPVFIIGHITKDGAIAGPKILEHMVDTVLNFEGDHHHVYRLLRTTKNRFGSTDELGIYEMRSTGLRQVSNPSELLLSQQDTALNGSAVAATLEGTRPLLVETQALVSQAVYGTPQRSATGFDLRRLSMLLAVLEKRCGIVFGNQDVFLNIAGGLRVQDPAIDLAIASALVSSRQDIPVDRFDCFAGEIGLSGEIRPVSRIEQRIQEAGRLGFKRMYLSQGHMKTLARKAQPVEIVPLNQLRELFEALFA